MEIADLKKLFAIGKEKSVSLIADRTIVPFNIFKANCFGIDIEIVSSTKYISGGATGKGGLVIDYVTFDWNHFSKQKELVLLPGASAFFTKMRKEIYRNLGAYMTPQVVYMQTLGLETISVRFDREPATCLTLAQKL